MRNLLSSVMDRRLAALYAHWQAVWRAGQQEGDPVTLFSEAIDHMLVIGVDDRHCTYLHYGKAFAERFGTDLTGQVIDVLPTDILPAERRGMMEFEYTFAHSVQRPLWRSYTASFENGQTETWQRLVLPMGQGRLVVGAYPGPATAPEAMLELDPAERFLRLVIERVPLVLDEEGQILDLALSLKKFSDTNLKVAELGELATRDALTGVANLRHFHHLAAKALATSQHGLQPLSVLALDIDHFKRINDTWGHPMGDAALKAFAGACSEAIRKGDILGRCGGEEFAVALPNAGPEAALYIAERLRQQVEQIALPLPDGTTLRFTVSIGVASCGADRWVDRQLDIPALLAHADTALYQSKTNGRNRVTLAPEV